MEKLQKTRKPIRGLITRIVNEIEADLIAEHRDIAILKTKQLRLINLNEQILTLDQEILGLLLEDKNVTEEEYELAVVANEEYISKIIQAKVKIEMACDQYNKNNRELSESDFQSVVGQRKRQFKLPKIELKKFDGKLINWLGWWSLFKKIHEDEELDTADKFHYLIQSMEEKTRAYDVVKGFPATNENYPKVIKALNERFGKKKLLTQVYIRELFQMGLKNLSIKPDIATLYDNLVGNVRSLESLGVTVEQATLFLYPMVESSLPDDIMIAWQRSSFYEKDGTQEQPPKSELDYLLDFLQQEVEREEQRSLAKSGFSENSKEINNQFQKKKESNIPTAAGLYVGDTMRTKNACIFCGKSHQSHECYTAIEMPLDQKYKIAKEKRVCSLCLRQGHQRFNCAIKMKCTGCFQRHYHLMCPDSPKNSENKETATQKQETITNNSGSNNVGSGLVMLKTILIQVYSKLGPIKARVLFDDGSHRSYITTALALKTKSLEVGKFFERNTLFGGVLSDIEERTIYEISVGDLKGKLNFKLELPNKEKITGKIQKLPKGSWFKELKDQKIWINDCGSENEEIDILIGADLIPRFTTENSINLKCGLKATETVFGWTVMGPLPIGVQLNTSNAVTLTLSQIDDNKIEQLWALESIGIEDPGAVKTKEERDQETRKHFIKTVVTNEEGRYQVSLPWIDGRQQIPNNYAIAEKRLINATKKLKSSGMYETYEKLFDQWVEEGFIEEVLSVQDKSKCHFIPHHPVYKFESKTTPVRPVFDASCKVGRNPSLNECLEKGPNMIELIPAVMIRFREGRIGVISDIRKAFQMIEVQERDQDYLMFLWWEKGSNEIKMFKHKRVVFGIKCSPFILGAVLDYHLNNVENRDAEIADKLRKSLYVDNSVTSVNSMEEFINFKTRAVRILAEAKMELRQWEYSTVESPRIGFIKSVGLGGDSYIQDEQEEDVTSVLGMKWNKSRDTLACASFPELPSELTKKTLLAAINKVFDPLGILTPAMLQPKLMLRTTWMQKIDWNENLSKDVEVQFKKWIEQLHFLKEIEVKRDLKGIGYSPEHSKEQLHIFCDASQMAYAAVVFVRVENRNGISIQLVQAKARMAPINMMTIPRLEVMGCVIGARLKNSIQKVFENQIPYFFWSDSSTALAWIKRNDEWGTFVGNRVREILKLSSADNWRHVPGKLNPADMPSRGCSPKQLLESGWWEGPQWLKCQPSEWPSEKFHINEEAVNAEKKKSIVQNNVMQNVSAVFEEPWFSKKSSHILNLREIALLRRFINNCMAKRRNLEGRSGCIKMKEIDEAEIQMVKMIQQQVFPTNMKYIAGIRVSRDEVQNAYCVVTKLLHRQDTGRFKKPWLLPCIHPSVDKIIMEEHLKYGHAGIQLLMSKLRERFWIIHTKKAVKRIIHKCTVCIRFGKSPPTVPPAPLPENRVKNAKVFEVTGIDLAGPLFLRNNEKEWVVIFTCAVIRAVHLELVEKVDAEQFLLALGRFIYRRGRPAIIYSDNGTNFKGTENLFEKLNWKKIFEETKIHRITWIFNPPASPWWGGFWERLIRTLKEYLRKILGHNKLTKSELDTSICFVESLMNGRPLTYISEDPDDLIPLTPSAFLQDIQQTEYPEIEEISGKKLREKLRHLNQLKVELRSRFRSEYLGQLVQHSKPRDDREFEVGEIVLIASEDKKRLEWPMARIIEIMPGADCKARVARLKTANGELVRPLQRLIPLEVSNNKNDLKVDEKTQSNAKTNRMVENEDIEKEERMKVKKKKNSVDGGVDNKIIITRSGRNVNQPIRFK